MGHQIGDGDCVAYVTSAAHAPPSTRWRKGVSARAAPTIAAGIATATLSTTSTASVPEGDRTEPFSSAGRTTAAGSRSVGQWAVHEHLLRLKGGVSFPRDDEDRYSIIEPARLSSLLGLALGHIRLRRSLRAVEAHHSKLFFHDWCELGQGSASIWRCRVVHRPDKLSTRTGHTVPP